MLVAEILQEKGNRVVTMQPKSRISDAARTLQKENIGAVLVKSNGGEILGIVSERDIVRSIALDGAAALESPLSDVMTKSVQTCTPETDTEALMEKMLSSRIRHLPVVSDGALQGIISIGDVVKGVVVGLKWIRGALQQQVITSAGWTIDED